jgi:GxxExxY protein
MILEARLGREILGAFYDAYNALGYGLPEKMCANALTLELEGRGLTVRREVIVDVMHLGCHIGRCNLDGIVENRVVLEVKSAKDLTDADVRQILTYLKVSSFEVGILLNFGPKPQHRRFIFTNDRKRPRSDSSHS